MPNPWFKFYGPEYIADPKMRSLTAAERSCWITLLSFASGSSTPGVIHHLTEDALMIDAGLNFQKDEWVDTVGVLKKFVKLDMITNDNEMITVLNWEKRQERAMSPYERLKKHRELKRDDNAMITPMITLEEEGDEEEDKDNTIARAKAPAKKSPKKKSTEKEPEPEYSSKSTRDKWFEGTEESFQLLAYFFDLKKLWPKLDTKEKLQHTASRYLRTARRIAKAGWSQDDFDKAHKRIPKELKEKDEWTLETIEKYLIK